MTDKEIIKALECCSKNPLNCRECGYKGRCNRIDCYDYLKRDAFDLINRQKVEIERLQKEVNLVSALFQDLQERTDEIKAEAYKEFAEKIKKSIKENVDEAWHRDDGNGIYDAEYVLDDIDNLLKEMVGEEE